MVCLARDRSSQSKCAGARVCACVLLKTRNLIRLVTTVQIGFIKTRTLHLCYNLLCSTEDRSATVSQASDSPDTETTSNNRSDWQSSVSPSDVSNNTVVDSSQDDDLGLHPITIVFTTNYQKKLFINFTYFHQ